MKITNKANLPDALVSAISTGDYRPKPNRISVTSLINPPQLESLKRKHWDDLEEDASDRIWALLGSASHSILEQADVDNTLTEEKLTYEVDGWTVSGKADLYDSQGVLSDYKVTSAYSFLHGVKPEWEAQLNLYALLYGRHGFEVNSLQIVAILRDWTKLKSLSTPDYPKTQVKVQPIVIWPLYQQQAYLETRLNLHRRAVSLDEYPPCTDEERWMRGEEWAVKKAGNKRAARVFDHATQAEADKRQRQEADGTKRVKWEVEHRPGQYMRCESYCPVSEFCKQWEAVREKGGKP